MNKPKMYTKVNNFQRTEAEYVIKNYFQLLRCRTNCNDKILDIGCGSGDVTYDLILPNISRDCTPKFDAVDKSNIMIEYAQTNFKHPNLNFYQLDITSESVQKFIDTNGKYDHIISFFCLNWILQQREAIENIYNLLNTNSDCLLLFCRDVVLYDAYEELAANPKWSIYMEDVKSFISPYRYFAKSSNDELGNLFTDVGFKAHKIDVKKNDFIFPNYESFKEFLRAVNPFLDRVPIELQNEFLCEHINIIHSKNLTSDGTYIFSYENFIVYAEK